MIEGIDYLLCNVCLSETGDSREFQQLGQHLKNFHNINSREYRKMFQQVPAITLSYSLKRAEEKRIFYKTDQGKLIRERYRKRWLENNVMHNSKFRENFDIAVVKPERRKKISDFVLEQYRTGKKKPPNEFIYRGCKTGYFHSRKNQKDIFYRSSLELKAYEYLENDISVVSFEGNEPVRIPLPSGHTYFPDILVTYVDGRKVLVEVKPFEWIVLVGAVDDCIRNGYSPLIEKIEAAEEFCCEQGWGFEVWTDNCLRV